MTAKKLKRDNPAQSRAFVKAARDVGADDGTSSTDDVMARLASMPPETHSDARKRQAKKRKPAKLGG